MDENQHLNPRELLKRQLLETRGHFCELKQGWPHSCSGGLEMHEAFYTRNHARTAAMRRYIVDERNCVLLCSWAHAQLGRNKQARSWLIERQMERYGRSAMKQYVGAAPMLWTLTLEELLF